MLVNSSGLISRFQRQRSHQFHTPTQLKARVTVSNLTIFVALRYAFGKGGVSGRGDLSYVSTLALADW